MTSASGKIKDHLGDGDYHPNTDCTWIISPNPPVDSILLYFTVINTSPGDTIYVYDGIDERAVLIRSLYGTERYLPPVVAVTGTLTVMFVSDRIGQRGGFEADYYSGMLLFKFF